MRKKNGLFEQVREIFSFGNSEYSSYQYPEFEFRKLAKEVSCSYEDVLDAFCLLPEGASYKNKCENFKIYESAVHNFWEVLFGSKRPNTFKQRSMYHNLLKKALPATSKLITTLSAIQQIPSNYYHRKYISADLPSLKQLENLKQLFENDTSKASDYSINPRNKKLDAEMLAERLAVLFLNLSKPVAHGSREYPSTPYAKALFRALQLFDVDAHYACPAPKLWATF